MRDLLSGQATGQAIWGVRSIPDAVGNRRVTLGSQRQCMFYACFMHASILLPAGNGRCHAITYLTVSPNVPLIPMADFSGRKATRGLCCACYEYSFLPHLPSGPFFMLLPSRVTSWSHECYARLPFLWRAVDSPCMSRVSSLIFLSQP